MEGKKGWHIVYSIGVGEVRIGGMDRLIRNIITMVGGDNIIICIQSPRSLHKYLTVYYLPQVFRVGVTVLG